MHTSPHQGQTPNPFLALPGLHKTSDTSTGIKIGQMVEGRGLYLGTWNVEGRVKHVHIARDFLKNNEGRQILLTFNQAMGELADRNGGRNYGNGSEAAIRKAVASGVYNDGDLVLPPREFLNGRDNTLNIIRPDNVSSLLRKAEDFRGIAKTVDSGLATHWALSSSERPSNSMDVYQVRLTNGDMHWTGKLEGRSAILPLRMYSTPPGLNS